MNKILGGALSCLAILVAFVLVFGDSVDTDMTLRAGSSCLAFWVVAVAALYVIGGRRKEQ